MSVKCVNINLDIIVFTTNINQLVESVVEAIFVFTININQLVESVVEVEFVYTINLNHLANRSKKSYKS